MSRRPPLGIALMTLSLLNGCGLGDPCGNEIVVRVPSPSGAHEAVVFERACGATTGWSTQVAIIGRGAIFNEEPTFWRATQSGDVLVLKDRAAREGVEGLSVVPSWSDDTHLVLAYDAGTVVAHSRDLVDGIAVERRAVEHAY